MEVKIVEAACFGRTEAFALFQIMYLVHDPPDWSCENGETFSDILLSIF
jgi:hypothetical protein